MDGKRSGNFTDKEVALLLDLVKKHKEIVECKKSDCKTWKEKEREWEQLAAEFNSLNGGPPRNSKNIRNKWDNMKKNAKKKFAKEKQNIFKTGGGSVSPVNITTQEVEIKELLGIACTGLSNPFDGDGDHNTNNNSIEIVFANDEVENICVFHEENRQSNNEEATCVALPSSTTIREGQSNESNGADLHKWNNWSPACLKTPMSAKLSADRNRISTTPEKASLNKSVQQKRKTEIKQDCRVKINVLSEARLELVKIQMECYQQEIRFKEEEHKQAMQIQALEIEKKELELDILKKKIQKD